MGHRAQLHGKSRIAFLGLVVALCLSLLFVLYSLWQESSSEPSLAPARLPPITVALVPNGTSMVLTATSFRAFGPFDLTNHSEWTPSGAWWQNSQTTDCLMTNRFYASWNNATGLRNCDGFTFYDGSPGLQGEYPIDGGFGIFGGVYYFVFYNPIPNTTATLTVNQQVAVNVIW